MQSVLLYTGSVSVLVIRYICMIHLRVLKQFIFFKCLLVEKIWYIYQWDRTFCFKMCYNYRKTKLRELAYVLSHILTFFMMWLSKVFFFLFFGKVFGRREDLFWFMVWENVTHHLLCWGRFDGLQCSRSTQELVTLGQQPGNRHRLGKWTWLWSLKVPSYFL